MPTTPGVRSSCGSRTGQILAPEVAAPQNEKLESCPPVCSGDVCNSKAAVLWANATGFMKNNCTPV